MRPLFVNLFPLSRACRRQSPPSRKTPHESSRDGMENKAAARLEMDKSLFPLTSLFFFSLSQDSRLCRASLRMPRAVLTD